MPGTVDKIIVSPGAGQPEKANIAVDGPTTGIAISVLKIH
jgi:anthranilate/para-aminobenzoate synthase component II